VIPLCAIGHDLAGDRLGLRQRGGVCTAGVLLMNPWSGGGKVARFGLVTEAQRRGVRAVGLGEGDNLVELAELAVRGGADVLGMAGGGDGSQALLADVACRHGRGFVWWAVWWSPRRDEVASTRVGHDRLGGRPGAAPAGRLCGCGDGGCGFWHALS